jgi:hypothetical protein
MAQPLAGAPALHAALLRAARGAGVGASASARGPGAAAWLSTDAPAGGGGGAAVKWVFLGPPGVGKGTYATRIAKHLGVPHIAAGDLVRAEIKSGSPLGKQVWWSV